MIHATWNAIVGLLDHPLGSVRVAMLKSCDWTPVCGSEALQEGNAEDVYLRQGSARPPTCPTCLMLIDLALSIRAESEQQRINEEINKERKAS